MIPPGPANQPTRDGDRLFHNLLMTWVNRIEYDWRKRCGQVWCDGPVDMSGTIELFTSIDDGVVIIIAYLGDKPDRVYFNENGKWEVRKPPRRRPLVFTAAPRGAP